jgi:sulfate permease, SulP family
MTTAVGESRATPVIGGRRLARVLPILGWLPSYVRGWFGHDLVAGIVIVCLLVPEGMAYAQIAGMPPETAFYVAPPALLLYALFASSMRLVVVVSATQAALSASAISPLATPGTAEWAALTAALAMLVGLITIAAGLFRLGKIAQFFSPSVLTGFVTGLALVIAIKQVPKILGIESGEGDFFERLWDILIHLGDVHGATLVIGFVTLATMVLVEQYLHRLPAALVALVVGIVLSRAFDLAARGVEVVEDIPSGLAAPELPDVAISDLTLLGFAALGIFLVNFAEANSVAQEFARRDGVKLDSNRELVGLGAANVGAGLFQGFTIGASLSKSAAADRAGMQTQVAGIVAAAGTILVALFLTGLFRELPEATLGAIVVVAVTGMMKFSEIRRLYALRRTDFLLALVALFGVLTLETLSALVLAVALSIVLLVYHAASAQVRRLGRLQSGAFADVRVHPDAEIDPAALVLRPDAELFFANAETVVEQVRDAVDALGARAVILDLESTEALDVPAADALERLDRQLAAGDVQLALARVHSDVRAMLERTGALTAIGSDRVYERFEQALADLSTTEQSQTERSTT